MKIYAIVCSAMPTLDKIKFYAQKEDASRDLRDIATERKYKPGILIVDDTGDKFSYLLGWEEHFVSFCIREVDVVE